MLRGQQMRAHSVTIAAYDLKLGDVEFVGGDLIRNQAKLAEALLPKIDELRADAFLVIHLAFGNAEPFAVLAGSGRPVGQ
jgi:hypothetical protein